MNLMKGITGYRGLRERKRGEDWERIWKRFGDAKHSSQELKKEGEIKLLTVCRCLAMQTDFSFASSFQISFKTHCTPANCHKKSFIKRILLGVSAGWTIRKLIDQPKTCTP